MKISDMLAMCFNNLMRRKSRTFLTTLGVFIGSVSITMMISLGIGMEKAAFKQMEAYGDMRVITIEKNSFEERSDSKKKAKVFDKKAIAEIEKVENVESVLGMVTSNITLITGKFSNTIPVTGVEKGDFEKLKIKLGKGNPFTGNLENEIILGSRLNTFYNEKSRNFEQKEVDLMGETFKLYLNGVYDSKGNKKKAMKVNVVGVVAETMPLDYGYAAFLTMDDLKKIMETDFKNNPPSDSKEKNEKSKELKKWHYSKISVICDKIENVKVVEKKLKEMGYNTRSAAGMLEEVQKSLKSVQFILGGIGGVSLLVAAIGITNAMIMSVYERTREIGIIKVLGAEILDILKMFLIEAAMIGFLGGVIGMLACSIFSHYLNAFAQRHTGGDVSYIPLWLYLGSISFSSLIGIIAGIAPAMRATKLSALEAIKTNS